MTPAQLKKVQPGDRIWFSQSAKRYWDENAFSDCSVKGVLRQQDISQYFLRKAISLSLEYTAVLISHSDDVGLVDGHPTPGALIRFTIGFDSDTTWASHDQLMLFTKAKGNP